MADFDDTTTEPADITQWLDAARGGDRGALDRVLATLYHELHAMARRQLAGQYGQTLDATVNPTSYSVGLTMRF